MEKETNLAVVLKMRELLENQGFPDLVNRAIIKETTRKETISGLWSGRCMTAVRRRK